MAEKLGSTGCEDGGVIDPFVSIDWLRENLDSVVLADCRWYLDGRSGRAAYDAGHIPGAVFVDLDTALTRHADPTEAGRHPLAEPGDFAAAMGTLGIGDEDTVIAYDDAGGVIAARLVWMLRVTGHGAALLDGGLAAWDGELATAPAVRAPTAFTASEWPADQLASIEEVAEISARAARSSDDRATLVDAASSADADAPAHDALAVATSLPVLIDARQRERYLGEPDGVDPRAGHIPGALSVPCRENLDEAGRVLSPADLRARFGVDDATEVISYCGSGVTACHNLLAMEQAGLGRGRLFPGSWSQWSRDPARAAETTPAGTP
jgi:thiosulfate/3-mercaptopyruvate sulfurtransferase